MLAKTVTTLDVLSGGRAVLGIGAGWFELEHRQFGWEFGTFTDRFERLDEALQIVEPMLRGQRPSFDGKWYYTENAINEPRIRDDLPVMLGESGEKKTFALAARFAQHLNIICRMRCSVVGFRRVGLWCGREERSARHGRDHQPPPSSGGAAIIGCRRGVSHYPLAVFQPHHPKTPKRMHSARCTAELDLTSSGYSPSW
jgi:alkanesulfonate monooxygenase SsuD/methylene tetrahydromethanopterin reductase-like flavin-dependent oxidoreductase (luciferase family)